MKLRERFVPALVAMLLAFAGPAAAQVELAAGRFIAVSGDVRVLGSDGASRGAERNGEFRQGESIVTGPNSLAQLRMTDGGAVSVRSDSQLKLDNYSYAGADDRNSSFFVSIVKGGFRTITGLIARSNRNNYRVSTSSATIGVRGTHFEVVHVVQPLKDAPAGTYNRVYDGTTTFQNRTGATVLVNREQTAFIPLPSNQPPVLVPPPAGLFGKPTPVPQVAPQAGDSGNPAARGAAVAVPAVQETTPAAQERTLAPSGSPARTLSAPLLNPIDSPRGFTAPATTLQQSPMLTPIDTGRSLTVPASTLQVTPTPQSTIDRTPATSTLSPVLTTPATSTPSPVLTSPATSTISPVLTAPVTITPIITAPVTTTISPVMTAPVTITPVITAPVTTTISPVFTAPATTIQTAPIIKR